MSNYSQLITSFERAGNFPLEANYVFTTEEDLKEFYSDEIEAATLHKGLLKIVESDPSGNQALYWVTKKETNDELEFTELVSAANISELTSAVDDLLEKLNAEITARENADTALWGTEDPSNIDEGYNSINDLANQLKATQEILSELEDSCITGENSLKNQLKALVGTTDNDIIAYLATLPYTNFTALAEAVSKIDHKGVHKRLYKLWEAIEGEVLPSEDLRTLRGIEDYINSLKTTNDYQHSQFVEELNNIETGVGLNADGSYSADSSTYYLSSATSIMNALKTLDNIIKEHSDEIEELSKIDLTFENGVLTLTFKGELVASYYIGLPEVVKSAAYDKDTKDLTIVFNLLNGQTETCTISLADIIESEWTVDNEGHTVKLEKVTGTTRDTLSADVNIADSENNILNVDESGNLYVKGTADNITTEDGSTVQEILLKQSKTLEWAEF